MKKINLRRIMTAGTALWLVSSATPGRADDAATATNAVATATNAPASTTGSETNQSALMQFLTRDYLLGDWGGVRSALSRHGVDFEFFYVASNPHNISGGIHTGAAYEGAFMMLLDLDSEKLAGYDGGHLHVGGLSLHGDDNFSAEHIGDLNKVNLVDFPNGWRLWELWYQQKFWGDTLSFKFGQMAVDQDFLVAQYYNSLASLGLFNQTFFYPTLAFNVFDIPGFPHIGNHGLASTPYGAPAALVKVNLTDRLYAQTAVYDGYPDQYNGTRVSLNSDDGALIYAETGFHLNQRKDDTGPPGNIMLGGYYDTAEFPDVYAAIFGNTQFHLGTWGLYFLADQTLYREIGKDDPAQKGLTGFFRLTGAPADRSLTQFGVDGGMVYKGLIPTRDYDTVSLAASYLEMSTKIRHGQEDVNALAPGTYPFPLDYEAVVELNYKAQMTAWWTVITSLQRPMHPGGSAMNRDAWALIFASTLRL
jgi:porin